MWSVDLEEVRLALFSRAGDLIVEISNIRLKEFTYKFPLSVFAI